MIGAKGLDEESERGGEGDLVPTLNGDVVISDTLDGSCANLECSLVSILCNLVGETIVFIKGALEEAVPVICNGGGLVLTDVILGLTGLSIVVVPDPDVRDEGIPPDDTGRTKEDEVSGYFIKEELIGARDIDLGDVEIGRGNPPV